MRGPGRNPGGGWGVTKPSTAKKKVFRQNSFQISKVVIFTWKMRNVLKRMKNQFYDFSFWEMVVFVLKIGPFSIYFEYKIDLTKKINIHFSFVSAHCASSILHILSWEKFYQIFPVQSSEFSTKLSCLLYLYTDTSTIHVNLLFFNNNI